MDLEIEILATLKRAIRVALLTRSPQLPFISARKIVWIVADSTEVFTSIEVLLAQQSPGSTTALELLTRAHDDFACRLLERQVAS